MVSCHTGLVGWGEGMGAGGEWRREEEGGRGEEGVEGKRG